MIYPKPAPTRKKVASMHLRRVIPIISPTMNVIPRVIHILLSSLNHPLMRSTTNIPTMATVIIATSKTAISLKSFFPKSAIRIPTIIITKEIVYLLLSKNC